MSVQKGFEKFKKIPSKRTLSLRTIVRQYKNTWGATTVQLDRNSVNEELCEIKPSKFKPRLLSPPLFSKTFHFGIRRTFSLKKSSDIQNPQTEDIEGDENRGDFRIKQKPFDKVSSLFKPSVPRKETIITKSPDFQPRINFVPFEDKDAFDKEYLKQVRQSLIDLRKSRQSKHF